MKLCPFCGSDKVVLKEYEPSECVGIPFHYYAVVCNKCGARGGTNMLKENAIKNWDARCIEIIAPISTHVHKYEER